MINNNEIFLLFLIIFLFIIMYLFQNNIEYFNNCLIDTCNINSILQDNKCIDINILYPMTTFTFTNCGFIGSTGPSLEQCLNNYSSTIWIKNKNYFNMIKQGIQIWTVPKTGIYNIEVGGASCGEI